MLMTAIDLTKVGEFFEIKMVLQCIRLYQFSTYRLGMSYHFQLDYQIRSLGLIIILPLVGAARSTGPVYLKQSFFTLIYLTSRGPFTKGSNIKLNQKLDQDHLCTKKN